MSKNVRENFQFLTWEEIHTIHKNNEHNLK